MTSQVQFSRIAELAQLINESTEPASMIANITYATCRFTSWDMCSIMSVDESAGLSVLMSRFDPFLSQPHNTPTQWDLAITPVQRVLEEGSPLIIQDAQTAEAYPSYQTDACARGYHTVVLLPLPALDELGRRMILSVHSRDRIVVDEDSIAFLKTISQLAAIAVDKANRFREQRLLAEKVRHTIESSGILMRRVLSDEAAVTVLSSVEALSDCPAVVFDHTARTISLGPRAADKKWTPVLDRLAAWMPRAVMETSPVNGPIRDSSGTFMNLVTNDIDHFRCENLLVDGALAGSFYLFSDGKGFDHVDEMWIQQVSFALSVMLMRSVIRFKERSETQAKIVEELLCGRVLDEEDLQCRAARTGLNLAIKHRIVLLGMNCRKPPLARQTLRANHRAISFELNRAWGANITVVPFGDSLVAFIPDNPEQSVDDGSRAMARAITSLTSVLGTRPVLAPGAACERLTDYSAAWQSCLTTFELSTRFCRNGVLYANDFGPYAMILGSAGTSEGHHFVAQMLAPLKEYDQQHRGDLLDTFEHYLANNCKLQKCASSLGIHVTTLRYRIERIQHITKANLENADVRFGFELAFRLRNMSEVQH